MSLNRLAPLVAALTLAASNMGCEETQPPDGPQIQRLSKDIEEANGEHGCETIIAAGETNIDRVPLLFKCEHGQVVPDAPQEWIDGLSDFGDTTSRTGNDCSGTANYFRKKIAERIRSLTCIGDQLIVNP